MEILRELLYLYILKKGKKMKDFNLKMCAITATIWNLNDKVDKNKNPF